MNLSRKSFPIQIKVKENPDDPNDRTVEGWASTFGNKDSYSDIIVPGAFAATLKERMPKMLWQHDSGELIGVWDTATETPQGLYVKGRFADTARGNEAYTLAKMGALDSMSIGYSTIDASYDYDTGVRTLKQLDLWEVSLVTFPANDQARITTVKAMAEDICAAHDTLDQAAGICAAYMSGDLEPSKDAFGTVHDHIRSAQALLQDTEDDGDDDKSAPMTIRAFEKRLRDAGFTQKQAKGIAAEGFKAIAPQRDAAQVSPHIELANLFRQFS